MSYHRDAKGRGFIQDAYNTVSNVVSHLRNNRYANKIRNIPILGSAIDNIPYIGTAIKFADEKLGIGKKKGRGRPRKTGKGKKK